jgi:hypothetical protein
MNRHLTLKGQPVSNQAKSKSRVHSAAVGYLEQRLMLTTSVWALGATLPAARGDSSALLASTGIYVFGGASATTSTRSVVKLDPDNNFQATVQSNLSSGLTGMGVGQSGFYAVIFGGKSTTTPLSTAQEYTVISNDGEGPVNVPAMSIPRAYFAYATDSSGDIYAIGGLSSSNQIVASAQAYNPTTNTWSAIAPLPTALMGASAASDGAGHIFVFGGQTSAGAKVSTVYRYTIASNSWDQRTSMPVAVSDATAVYAFYGSIYVAGGKTAGGASNEFELYNPVLDSWTNEGTLPSAVYGAAGVVDYNSNLDLIGGFNATGIAVNTVEYTPVAPSTVALPQPPVLGLGYYSGNTTIYGTYDGTPQPATATAVDPTYQTKINGTFTFTYNGSSTAPTNAGTYNVLAYFTSQDPNYVDSVIAGTYTISPASPTITVSGGGTFTYDGHAHGITATEVGVDGVTPAAGAFSYTYNGLSTAPTTWGIYSAVATFTSADPNYSNATSSAVTINIPDPRIVTGVTVTGASSTSVTVSWNPVQLPDGSIPLYNLIEESYYTTIQTVSGGSGRDGGGSHQVIVYNYTFPVIAANLSGTSLTVPTAIESAYVNTAPYLHPTFQVESVDTAASPLYISAASNAVSGDPLYSPVAPASAITYSSPVEVGNTVSLATGFLANETPAYSLSAVHPASMSVNSSGGVTYTPALGDPSTVSTTVTATNSLGSASEQVIFNVIQRPRVVVNGGTFSYDGNVHTATAVAYDINGNVMAGTFTYQYQPVGINAWSTASYNQPGTYNVIATFTPSVPGYGPATGTGIQVITPSTLQVVSFPGPTGYIGLDSTGANMIVSGLINGQGSFSNQYAVSSFDTLNATGSYLGTNLEIDLTNGNPIPVNGLTFAGGEVANANSITIVDNSGNPDTIVASSNQLIVNGRVINYATVGFVMLQTIGVASLDVESGNFEIPGNSGTGINVANFSSISIGAGATLTVMNPIGQSPKTVLSTAGLSIAGSVGAWAGTLDLGSNDLIVNNTASSVAGVVATITDQLRSGYNDGLWTGTGIQSSVAATDSSFHTTLGMMRSATLSTFDTQPVDSNSVLIKYTYYGDTNLDGQVDGSDYSRLDNGYLTHAQGWNNGDVNYDGVIDGSDYTLTDNAFNFQGAVISAQVASQIANVAVKPAKALSVTAHPFQTATPISISAAGVSFSDVLTTKKDLLDQLGIK